jgi:hypothetical protein
MLLPKIFKYVFIDGLVKDTVISSENLTSNIRMISELVNWKVCAKEAIIV